MIEDAFWAVSRDLETAIVDQAPDKLEGARAMFRREALPLLKRLLVGEGFKVVTAAAVVAGAN